MEFVPLKDKPQSNHDQDQDQDEEEEELEPYLLDRDRRDPTDIPTPDVSPEEMSDSSEDLVGQGDLAESRSSSLEGSHRQQRHHSYPRPGVALQGDEDSSSWSWLKDSPFLDALVNWIEGPDAVSQPKNQEKDKPNPWLDIPFQFIALLTYPEPDAKTGNKMTLTRNFHLPIYVIVVFMTVMFALTSTPFFLFFLFDNNSCKRDGICSTAATDFINADSVYPTSPVLQLRLFHGGPVCQQLCDAIFDEELGPDER